MRDPISRQAAIDVMCELMRHWFGGDPKDEIREIKRELEKLPSAQPEIIRCKDCKYYLCPHGCGHIDGMVTSQKDGFCSYAERREE